jgi:EmrB/QacA subfamily drug resistance transporter
VAFVVGVFMDVLDTTIVNVALPTIGKEFAATDSGLEWVLTGYLLSLAVWIPASGWLGDRFGTKRIFCTAIVVFTVGSAMCGLAQSIEQLIVFRILQGVGGGMLVPVGQSMLYRAFPPHERARASSVLSIPTVLGPALGPVLGGIITTQLSWRWIFLVNLPVGIVGLAFCLVYLGEHTEPTAGAFDKVGFFLSGIAFGAVLFGLAEVPRNGWTGARTLVPIVIGLVLVAVLVVYENRNSAPMLAFRLFANRAFRIGNIVNVTVTSAFIGSMFVLPLYLQRLRGFSPQQSGLATFTQAIGFILATRSVGKAYLVIGPRRLILAGLVAGGLVNLSFVFVDLHTSLWWIRLIMFARGLCLPLLFIPLQASSFATISPADTGRGSSLFATQRQLSGALGVAFLGAILFTQLTTRTTNAMAQGKTGEALAQAQLTAYHHAFAWVVVLFFLGALVSLAVRDADAANTMRGATPATTPTPASD